MNWVLLNSSAIRAVAYAGGELHIIFQSSDFPYPFPGVPFSEYVALINADSPGTYYNAAIGPKYGLPKRPRKKRR